MFVSISALVIRYCFVCLFVVCLCVVVVVLLLFFVVVFGV